MNQDLVLDVALPLTLFLMMLSMGSTLRPADFAMLLRRPATVAVGLSSQLLLLPLLTLGLLGLMRLSALPMSMEIYAGFVILALSPGGSTSNVFSYLAAGNVALSISLTAVVSLIAPLSLPPGGELDSRRRDARHGGLHAADSRHGAQAAGDHAAPGDPRYVPARFRAGLLRTAGAAGSHACRFSCCCW